MTEESRSFQEPDALAMERIKSALGKKKINVPKGNLSLEQLLADLLKQ
jgi:hypothetical protein